MPALFEFSRCVSESMLHSVSPYHISGGIGYAFACVCVHVLCLFVFERERESCANVNVRAYVCVRASI